MKLQKTILTTAAAALTLWAAGCKEQSQPTGDPAANAVSSTENTVGQMAEAAKDAGAQAVQNVTEKAKEAAAPVSAKAQELIDTAKKLVGEGKLQEALAKLKEIGGEKLSVDQQAMVDALKAQIEKALGATNKAATDAASAAGGLIPTK